MSIQWFPGHMHKARVEMAKILPKVDLVIEILDARIPYSSENPMLAEMRGDKPCLKVLNKTDLADSELTSQWRNYLERQENIRVRAVCQTQVAQVRQIADACTLLCPTRQGVGKVLTAMICGIPNVGKSTIINLLAGRKVAKTGNEPAVTKAQQRVRLPNGVVLLDTPGVLWPKVDNAWSGYRLAALGSIRETAMDYEDVAFHLCGFLLKAYPDRLAERYKLDPLPTEPVPLLDAIGTRRGCLNKRGNVDYERVARIILTELRSGKLGGVTLETPEMMERERHEVAEETAARAAAKIEHDAERKARFRDRQRNRRE